jgi:phosphoribosylformylglycinamidine synthase
VATPESLAKLIKEKRVPLTYRTGDYPSNPNGSLGEIAALCNKKGNVMGLMPHPENNVLPWQSDPKESGPLTGLALFRNTLRNLS